MPNWKIYKLKDDGSRDGNAINGANVPDGYNTFSYNFPANTSTTKDDKYEIECEVNGCTTTYQYTVPKKESSTPTYDKSKYYLCVSHSLNTTPQGNVIFNNSGSILLNKFLTNEYGSDNYQITSAHLLTDDSMNKEQCQGKAQKYAVKNVTISSPYQSSYCLNLNPPTSFTIQSINDCNHRGDQTVSYFQYQSGQFQYVKPSAAAPNMYFDATVTIYFADTQDDANAFRNGVEINVVFKATG